MFSSFDFVLVLYSLRRGRALRIDPGPMTRGWLRRIGNRDPLRLPDGLASRGFVFLQIFLW